MMDADALLQALRVRTPDGKPMSPPRGHIHDDLVMGAREHIRNSGVVDLVTQWRADDVSDRARRGGRPPLVTDLAILTGVTVLGLLQEPITLVETHRLLTARITPAAARLLDVPARRPSYYAVTRAFARVADVIDPRPFPTRRRPTWGRVQEIDAARDPERVAELERRSRLVGDALIEASLSLAPAEISGWDGDVAIDGTKLPVWGRRGNPALESRTDDTLMSPEVNAGWHAKTEVRRENSETVAKPGAEYTFAYEAHIAMMVTGRDQPQARLILGFSLDRPGVSPAQNAVKVLESIKSRGYKPGRLIVDRGYSSKRQEDFHRPVRGLGYDPVMDYQRTELGIQGSYGGMVMLGGTYYCPATPQPLRSLYADRETKRIDDDTFGRRLDQLQTYRMRPKNQWTPSSTSITFRCPAAGPRPLALCPNKDRAGDRLAIARGKRRALPIMAVPPEDRPPVCANRDSISVPVGDLPKQFQALAYLTDDWLDVYKPGRSQNEGLNGFVKDPTSTDIGNAGQFRFRGYGKRLIGTAILFSIANLRILRAHVARTSRSSTPQTPRPRRGRPPAETFASRNQPDHGPPPGRADPEQPSHVA